VYMHTKFVEHEFEKSFIRAEVKSFSYPEHKLRLYHAADETRSSTKLWPFTFYVVTYLRFI
jgi:hypothetical protein